MAIEFAERIRRIPRYPLAAGYDLGSDVAMLASNESCFAPSIEVLDAASRAMTGVHRYPDPSYQPVRQALADRYGIPRERIALGNGSCDILLATGEALLEPGAEVVYAWPAFSVYPHLAAASGATAMQVPLDASDRHDLDAIAGRDHGRDAAGADLQPQQPDVDRARPRRGRGVPGQGPVARVRDPRRGLLRVCARARGHYASLELIERFPNLMLLRTFSKAYGLAGLRVGYGLCGSEALRAAVDQVRQPFYLNVPAQAAAVEALRHQDEVERRVTHTVAARIAVTDGLRELGLWVADSDANFVWTHLPDADAEPAIVVGLRERGVLVRAGGALGRPGSLRVTVGTDAENRRFLAAIGELL